MLTDLTLHDLEYVCLNMRAADAEEILAMRPHDSRIRLAWEAYHHILNNGRGKIAWHNGKPAAVSAFTEVWPGRWEVWMFGTDDFKAAAVPLLRWFRHEANDILTICRGNRLECDSRMGHDEAHAMIQAFGGKPEGPPMQGYGKDGCAYQRFVWLPGQNDGVLKPGFTRAA